MMDGLKEATATESGGIVGSLFPREDFRSFAFPTFPLKDPAIVDDFKQECKVWIYIRARHNTFGCDPTNNEVVWWLESLSHVYTYGSSFMCVDSNFKMDNSHPGTQNITEDDLVV